MNNLENRMTIAGSHIKVMLSLKGGRFDGLHMSFGEVHDMDVVSNAGAIRRGIVVAVYLHGVS